MLTEHFLLSLKERRELQYEAKVKRAVKAFMYSKHLKCIIQTTSLSTPPLSHSPKTSSVVQCVENSDCW